VIFVLEASFLGPVSRVRGSRFTLHGLHAESRCSAQLILVLLSRFVPTLRYLSRPPALSAQESLGCLSSSPLCPRAPRDSALRCLSRPPPPTPASPSQDLTALPECVRACLAAPQGHPPHILCLSAGSSGRLQCNPSHCHL